MTKFTNESSAGRARAASYGSERAPLGGNINEQSPPAMKVDPSIRLGDIKGEILGNVPMSTQLRKPAAYQGKKGSP